MSPTSSLKTGAELRRAFLDFFVQHGHAEVPSSPLVPHGDPTLMFTTAGMVQFKPYYSATGDVPYTRATSVQKCLRLTDLDNVGLTPRHDTFFEMLGNFSFGPRAKGAYFKDVATAYAWHFVPKVLGLPKERLHVSIFEGEGKLPRDDEAAALWKKLGVAGDHIVALGRKDNFWGPAGGAGGAVRHVGDVDQRLEEGDREEERERELLPLPVAADHDRDAGGDDEFAGRREDAECGDGHSGGQGRTAGSGRQWWRWRSRR